MIRSQRPAPGRRQPVAFKRVPNPLTRHDCIEVVSHFRSKQGYVQLNVPSPTGSKHVPAHRQAWLSKYGPESIPEGWEVDHICGNRACVNRAHLRPLERSDHKRITNKGRGEAWRELALCHWLATGCTGAEIGRRFSVTAKHGARLVKRWRSEGHIPGNLPKAA